MSRGNNQKLKLYYLAKILLEKTDEQHGLTMPQIIQELEKYEVSAERKSVYADFDALEEAFGIEILCEQQGRQHYYHVGARLFELAELKLLVDAIQSSKFITLKKSKELISKLEGMASTYEAKELQRQVFVQQLDLAAELDLPVIIHCRSAYEDLWPVLSSWLKGGHGRTGVLHAFDETPEAAKAAVDLGMKIGMGGPYTYRKKNERNDIVRRHDDRVCGRLQVKVPGQHQGDDVIIRLPEQRQGKERKRDEDCPHPGHFCAAHSVTFFHINSKRYSDISLKKV